MSMTLALPLISVPEILAGFIYGMTTVNHLEEIEHCYQTGGMIEQEVEAAISSFEKGGWNADVQGALYIALAILQIPEVLGTCEGMDEDIAAIEEWASVFSDPSSIAATAAKHIALHRKQFKADLAQTKEDIASGFWFHTGEDVADVAMDAFGPIKPDYSNFY